MLHQSKPIQHTSSEGARARALLLSLDYEGTGRYPVPQSTVRRDAPLDRLFLLAANRDSVVRPTHRGASSDTVGSTSTWSAGSCTSSPTRSPRETTVGAPWDRSPLSMNVVTEAYCGIVTEDEQEILDDGTEQHQLPSPPCEHSRGIKGSIRRKFGRKEPCRHCSEAPAKPLSRQSSWIGRSLSLRGRTAPESR